MASKLDPDVEDILALPDDGYRHELVNGVHHVSPAPGSCRQRAVVELVFRLRSSCPPALAVLVAPFAWVVTDVRHSPRGPTRPAGHPLRYRPGPLDGRPRPASAGPPSASATSEAIPHDRLVEAVEEWVCDRQVLELLRVRMRPDLRGQRGPGLEDRG